MPGELVAVEGARRLHVLCKGPEQGPTVIFEAGLSPFPANSAYAKVQALIAPFARVCSYDRAGLGWSDPAPPGRNIPDLADDLHRLIEAARVPGPYILVGHSMGGLIVRSYVTKHPGSVAGVVLADASSETLFTTASAASRDKSVADIDAALKTATPGVPVIALPPGADPMIAFSLLPEILATQREENFAVSRSPPSMLKPQGFGTLGDIPLIVIRRGLAANPPSATDTAWRAAQEQMTALSTNSRLIVAERSGHVIPFDRPDVVADAVRSVIEAARSGGRP
ncbi:MAG TPA: alpha/beta hydrolase [Hyphomonadaceae bacterium]|nr:alpha/beta hydrolase [Hyphomonadaceae bacterium]